MAFDVFARSAPGRVLPLCDRLHARALHLARACAANGAGLLARNLGQWASRCGHQRALAPVSRCWRSICDDGCVRLGVPMPTRTDWI